MKCSSTGGFTLGMILALSPAGSGQEALRRQDSQGQPPLGEVTTRPDLEPDGDEREDEGQSPIAQVDAIGRRLGLEGVGREELARPMPFHPLYRPRGEAETLPAAGSGFQGKPVQDWPERSDEEDPDRHPRRWAKRMAPDDLASAIARARSMPSELPGAISPLLGSTTSEWEQIGAGMYNPWGHHRTGRIRQAQYAYDDRQSRTTLWLGATGGGVWKVVGFGIFAFWVPVTDRMPGAPSCGAFLVHPGNSERILVGTGDLFRTPGSGVYGSEDQGDSWTRLNVSPTPSSVSKILPDSRNANIVLMSTDRGIFRSTDFGASWTRVYSGNTTDLVQDPVTDRFWWAGAPGVGVLESDDYGQSFHPIGGNGGAGITGTIGRISLSVCDAAANHVYALIEGPFGAMNGVYRSTNWGYNWAAIQPVDTISWGQAFHTNAITVHPADPNLLFVGMGGFQFTRNAAVGLPTWIDSDPGHADNTSFLAVPNAVNPGNTLMVCTNDGGYYIFNHATEAVDSLGNLLGLNCGQSTFTGGFCMAGSYSDPDRLAVGTQDNGILRIDTGHARKLEYRQGGDGGKVNISPNNPDEFFASIGLGWGRWYSNNTGLFWWNVDESLPAAGAATPMSDSTPGFTTIYANDLEYLYWAPPSVDPTWSRVNNGHPLTGINGFDQAHNTAEYVFYVLGSNHQLYVLDGQGGSNPLGTMDWDDRTPPLPPLTRTGGCFAAADRSSLQPNTVYYVSNWSRPSRAYLSTNRGVTWQNVTGDMSAIGDVAFYELLANPSNLNELYLATQVGVFRSLDRGAHWHRFMAGLPEVLDTRGGLELNYDNSTPPILRVASYGHGWFERELSNCEVHFEPFGVGLPGAGGYVPQLSGTGGPCATGAYTIHLRNGLGAAPVLLLVGVETADTSLFGGHVYIDFSAFWNRFPLRLFGAPGSPGAGQIDLPGAPLSIPGARFYLQMMIEDGAAVRGISLSNGLEIIVE